MNDMQKELIPMEPEHDAALARNLGCSIDIVRRERTEAFKTIQRKMRERGHDVPDDLAEFAKWCRDILGPYRLEEWADDARL